MSLEQSRRKKMVLKKIRVLSKLLRDVITIIEVDEILEICETIDHVQSYWVHPINQKRPEQGDGIQLYAEMRQLGGEEFFNYTRLTFNQFDHLLDKLYPTLNKIKTRPDVIPPHARLFLVLRALASGDSIKSLHYSHRMGCSTASKMIKEICEAIIEELRNATFPRYTSETWIQIAHGFERKSNFPNILGALDGKHVHIKAPPNRGSEFHNFKDHSSVILMGLCDADLQFTYASVGEMGSSSDSSVFRRCGLNRMLQNMQLDQPPPSSVRGSNQNFPYVFVGDAAFPLRPEIMTPYARRGPLTDEESHFNKELSRARISIENAFGVLTARWRIMGKICELQPAT